MKPNIPLIKHIFLMVYNHYQLRKCKIFCFLLFLLFTNICYAQKSTSLSSLENKHSVIEGGNSKGGIFKGYEREKEDLSLRNAYSKHFKNEDGSNTAVVSTAPIHYKAIDGNWADISTEIITNTSNTFTDYKYYTPYNSFSCYFSESTQGGFLMKMNDDFVKDWLNPEVGIIKNDGNYVTLNTVNNVLALPIKNQLIYHEAYPGIDVQVIQLYTGKKLNYIMQNNQLLNNAPDESEYLVFSEKIEIPSDWIIKQEHVRTPGSKNDDINIINRLSFVDGNGKTVMQIRPPKVYDSYIKKAVIESEKKIPSNNSNNVIFAEFQVQAVNGGYIIKKLVPVNYLKDNNRVFPIIVDPITTDFNTANTTYHTGWTDGSTKTTGEIWYGDYRSQRGWARWTLTGVTNTVTNVTLKIYTDNDSYGSSSVGFYKMTTDPLTESAANIYNNLYTTLYTSGSYSQYTQYSGIDLGTTADADINSHPTWFGLGIGMTWNDSDWGEMDGHPYNFPVLSVTYTPCTPPAAPTANAATGAGCTSFTANWNAVGGATAYYLDVDNNSDFSSPLGGYNNLNVGNVTSYSVTGLTAGVTYYYRVRSFVSCASSNSNTITQATLPATPATPGVISGNTTLCPSVSGQTYSISAVTNATSYNWTVPAGWTINSGNGTTSISVTTGGTGANGNISVTAGNSCGTSAARTLAVTVIATPATPGVITGTTPQCPGLAGQTYSIAAVTYASSYTWTVPAGWTINSGNGTTSISVTTGTAGQNGNIAVTAGNTCGTSSAQTKAVTVNPGTPATPGAISGTAAQFANLAGQVYSISAVPNATTYNWNVPTGWSITAGSGTTSITVTTGACGQNGNITVTAQNSCGISAASTKAVTSGLASPTAVTATPGTICPSNSSNLNGTSAGNTINWYTVSTGGTPIGNSASGVNYNVSPGSTTTYYAEAISAQTQTYNFTGGQQTFVVPAGVTSLDFEVWGAEGGGQRLSGNTSSGYGGKGGYSRGTLAVTPGNTVYIYVGGYGASSTSGIAAGGYNGGGSGYAFDATEPGNGGGGATDVRYGGTAYANRVIIAGGGGGGGEDSGDSYGHGGGTTGVGYATYDATQSAAGSGGGLGYGGSTNFGDGGGGGGGYYGGGTLSSGSTGTDTQGGGGGSGYIGGVTNGTTIDGNSSMPNPVGGTMVGKIDNGYTKITYASSGCVSVSRTSVGVTVSPATPATPGAISGTAAQCAGLSGQTYSISAVPNASTYNWNVPAGWTINSGQGTTSISVTTGSGGQNGNITVTAGNSCGTSAAQTKAVTVVATPAQPGAITGIPNQCPALTSQTYSISAVTYATTYNWSVPTGWSITAGGGTTSIIVTTGAAGQNGNISVTATGICGTSAARTLAVTVKSNSTAPTSISASTNPICAGNSTNLTVNGGSLGSGAVWKFGYNTCGPVFIQPWNSQPYGTDGTTVNSSGGILNVTSFNGDPMIYMSGLGSFDPSIYKYVQMRYRVVSGTAGTVEIFFYNTAHGGAVGGESASAALVSDGAWHVANVNMGSDPDYTLGGNITGWRFDWCGNTGVNMEIDYISLTATQGSPATVSPTTSATYYAYAEGDCNITTCANLVITVIPNDGPVATNGTGQTSTSFNANWNTLTGATAYYLDVSTNSSFSSFVAGYNNLNVGLVTTYPVTGLTANTQYFYRVRATTAGCGTTLNSNTISTWTRKYLFTVDGDGGQQYLSITAAIADVYTVWGTTPFDNDVIVRVYTYSGGNYTGIVAPNSALVPTSSGRLVFEAAANETPIINATGNAYGFNISETYVKIQGFTVYGATTSNIYVNGSSNEIGYNKCYNSGATGIYLINSGTQSGIHHNLCYNNGSHGIHVVSSTNTVVQNNSSVNNGSGGAAASIWSDDFSTATGWTLGTNWARGSTTGSSSCSGSQDPANDNSPTGDNYVLGYILGGCYANDMTSTYYATSPTINLTGYTNQHLTFYRWLGIESPTWDHVYIDVWNGSSWVNIWQNTSSVADYSWLYQDFDVSAYANASFKFRFGLGVTDASVTYCGWNIDDVVITGNIAPNGANALYVQSGTGTIVKNNMLQARSGSGDQFTAFQTATTINTGSSGYNNIYNNGNTNVVKYNGTPYATIAAWNAVVANNICADSKFINTGVDFHLNSKAGSYTGGEWPPLSQIGGTWTYDTEDSPNLDAGNPSDAVSDEPAPNKSIVNIGCYGGTSQASKSKEAPTIEDPGAGNQVTLYKDRGRTVTIQGTNLIDPTATLGGISGTLVAANFVSASFTFPAGNYPNNTLVVSNGVTPNATSNNIVTIATRNIIPVKQQNPSEDDHPTITSAVNGLWAWWGATNFDANKTIRVFDGSYSEGLDINKNFNPTAANRLRFEAAPGAAPVIDATGFNYGLYINDAAGAIDYVTVKGFEIKNATIVGIWTVGTNDTISSNIIHDCGTTNIRQSGTSATSVIEYNKCYNTAKYGIELQTGINSVTIKNNLCYNHKDHGIYITNTATSTIKNNTCYGNGSSTVTGGSAVIAPNPTSGTVNIAIPDGACPTFTESNISVTQSQIIQDVNVRIKINHTYDWDLKIYLRHPDGTQVGLAVNNGSSGDNFTDTWFDDQAATHISAGVAPFTGTYIPVEALSALNGKNTNGTWKLLVCDGAGSDVGTIVNWELSITYATAPSYSYNGSGLYIAAGSGHLVQNNIFVANTGSGDQYYAMRSDVNISTSSGFNTYFKNGNTNFVKHTAVNYSDSITWNNTSYGNSDCVTNPQFVNPGTDFHLKSMANSSTYAGGSWPPYNETGGSWSSYAGFYSSCIDKGNTADAYANEQDYNGGKINQGCYGNTVQATRSCYVTPNYANAGPDQPTACPNPNVTLAGNAPPAGTGAWTGTGTFADPNLNNTTVSDLNSGANTLTWTMTHNGCVSSDQVVITNVMPTIADAGLDQTLLSGNSAVMAANTPTVGTGAWSVILGTVSSYNPNNASPAATVNGLANGLNTLRWTITSASCPASFDDVDILKAPDHSGIMVTGDITNNGTLIMTDDNNKIIVIGSTTDGAKGHILGSGTYTNAKFKFHPFGSGTPTAQFNATVSSGSIAETEVSNSVFEIVTGKTYKTKNMQINSGTTLSLTGNTAVECLKDWTNLGTITWANTTPVIKLLGTGNTQIVHSNKVGSQFFENISLDNKNGSNVPGTIYISDDIDIKTNMSLSYGIMNGSVLTAGTGIVNAGATGPFYNYYENNKTQMLYTNAELGNVKKITHLAIDVSQFTTTVAHRSFNNFTIKVDHTVLNSLPNAAFTIIAAAPVFSANPYSMPAEAGWIVFDVDDFIYDGTRNLIVEITWGDNGTYCAEQNYFKVNSTDFTATGNYMMSYGYADAVTPPNYGGRSFLRPNMRFIFDRSGFLNPSLAKTVIFRDQATTSGYSDNSFVDATVKKIGNDNFTFPTGNVQGTVKACGPVNMNNSAGLVTHEYTARYKHRSTLLDLNVPFWSNVMEAGLHHVSSVEYWNIEASGGAPQTRDVTIYTLDMTRSGMNASEVSDIAVGHYGGALWDKKGDNAWVSDGANKGHLTGTTFTTYSPITFGSKTGKNPLPVEMAGLMAECQNGNIEVKWTTFTEINNAYFLIQKSEDMSNWTTIANVTGAGNSNEIKLYSYYDLQANPAINYYRLIQTDYDGNATISQVVSASCSQEITAQGTFFNAYYDADNRDIVVQLSTEVEEGLSLKLYDCLGRELGIRKVNVQKGYNSFRYNMHHFAAGAYFIVVESKGERHVRKIVY
ncbi:MAG: hypothetical protein A2275_09300 [Bacteroidetes bacterium RIFOXYA12_FULL_35_11]|nr:MAG: hypothetical protein A2X01_13100 [Bacteroidetes bacterium GWF2_35_48]OFY78094.1 MAG: hypothetical protein A2275_09300 [Bacteroidetes bacterium RIFOXYA12_FULL_35_11]